MQGLQQKGKESNGVCLTCRQRVALVKERRVKNKTGGFLVTRFAFSKLSWGLLTIAH